MTFRLERYSQPPVAEQATDIFSAEEFTRQMVHEISVISRFRRLVSFYYHPRRGLDPYHDVTHIARALVNCSALNVVSGFRGEIVDASVTYWTLVLHDVMSNPINTPDHGVHGALVMGPYVMRNPLLLLHQKRHIISNIYWHNKRDEQIPKVSLTRELSHVKNADALDLLRMNDGREIVLTNPDALCLAGFASRLYTESVKKTSGNDFENVLQVARGLLNENIAYHVSL